MTADPTIGSILGGGRYRLVAPLGRGGMGIVYEALQLDIGRKVALKLLIDASDAADLERFRREAKLAASLGHPNIVQVTELSTEPPDPPFLVMELLRGRSLRQLLRAEGRIAAARVATMGVQALSALAAAHRAHVIHRDIKPENLFLVEVAGGQDLVKVLDFGIARPLQMSPLTQGGTIGTLGFMSPEQLAGDPVDARTDIFAIGATLYLLAAGRPAIAAPTRELLAEANFAAVVKPLEQIMPDVDRAFAAIVHRALRRLPEGRFATADEMQEALTEWLARPRVVAEAHEHAAETVRDAASTTETAPKAPSPARLVLTPQPAPPVVLPAPPRALPPPIPRWTDADQARYDARLRTGKILALAVAATVGLLFAVAWYKSVYRVHFVNDSDVVATVTAEGKRAVIAPRASGELVFRRSEARHVDVAFADGTTASFDVHPGKHFAAYAVRGADCFGLVDASSLVGAGGRRPYLVQSYERRHDLEYDDLRAAYFLPSELPPSVTLPSTQERVLWLTPVPCDVLADGKATAAWEEQLGRARR